MSESVNNKPKRFRFVTCKVLQREAYLCASRSRNIVDVEPMPQGLHNDPDKLREEVQRAVQITSDVQGRPYDAIVVGYALCSNGIVGVTAEIPTIIPRGHDCITLILGSKERYKDYFNANRGIYWYSAGWIETTTQPGKERYESALAKYREKYGEDNAEYLMEMEQSWMREYSKATYIDWDFEGASEYRNFTKKCAEYLGWSFDELKGDQSLLQHLVDGEWDHDSFLVLKPGQTVVADVTNNGIIAAKS